MEAVLEYWIEGFHCFPKLFIVPLLHHLYKEEGPIIFFNKKVRIFLFVLLLLFLLKRE
jgi:hypothetical protein